jgi:hypothetical protein
MDCIRYVTLLLFVTRCGLHCRQSKVNWVLDAPQVSLSTIAVKSNICHSSASERIGGVIQSKPWSLKLRES